MSELERERSQPTTTAASWAIGSPSICSRRADDEAMSKVDRLFLLFMGLVGVAIGIVLVVVPESRTYKLPPYFWVLIAMAMFEITAFVIRERGIPGVVVTMRARILGFALALVLVIVIPVLAGSPGPLF